MITCGSGLRKKELPFNRAPYTSVRADGRRGGRQKCKQGGYVRKDGLLTARREGQQRPDSTGRRDQALRVNRASVKGAKKRR